MLLHHGPSLFDSLHDRLMAGQRLYSCTGNITLRGADKNRSHQDLCGRPRPRGSTRDFAIGFGGQAHSVRRTPPYASHHIGANRGDQGRVMPGRTSSRRRTWWSLVAANSRMSPVARHPWWPVTQSRIVQEQWKFGSERSSSSALRIGGSASNPRFCVLRTTIVRRVGT